MFPVFINGEMFLKLNFLFPIFYCQSNCLFIPGVTTQPSSLGASTQTPHRETTPSVFLNSRSAPGGTWEGEGVGPAAAAAAAWPRVALTRARTSAVPPRGPGRRAACSLARVGAHPRCHVHVPEVPRELWSGVSTSGSADVACPGLTWKRLREDLSGPRTSRAGTRAVRSDQGRDTGAEGRSRRGGDGVSGSCIFACGPQ